MNARHMLLAAVVLAAHATAQEDPQGKGDGPAQGQTRSQEGAAAAPQPSAQMQKYEPLLGTWQGSGTAAGPAGDQSEWDATIAFRKIMGGHFVQEDVTVTAEGMPSPLVFRTLHGYDRENQRYLALGVGNDGEIGSHEIAWLDDQTMAFTGSSFDAEGQPRVFRTVSKLSGDSMSYRQEGARGTGPWSTLIEGNFSKISKIGKQGGKPADADAAAVDAAFGGAQPNAPMQRLQRLAGTWKIEGRMRPTPQAEWVPITGTETISPMFGGLLLKGEIHGESPGSDQAYHGTWYIGWDAHERRYRELFASSMGEIGSSHGEWIDDTHYVGMSANRHMGKPTVGRGLLRVDAQGKPVEYTHHVISGAEPPAQTFEAKYSKAKAAAGAEAK